MPIFYSPSKKGFYDTKVGYSSYPSDIVDVTDRYQEIFEALNSQNKEISFEFGDVVLVEKPKKEITWDQIKKERNALLLESDWTQLLDVNLPNKEEWKVYRQQLREITTNFSNPNEVIFPPKPQ
jgi:hypothetical protein